MCAYSAGASAAPSVSVSAACHRSKRDQGIARTGFGIRGCRTIEIGNAHTCRLELANRHYHAITRSVYCVFSFVNDFGHIFGDAPRGRGAYLRPCRGICDAITALVNSRSTRSHRSKRDQGIARTGFGIRGCRTIEIGNAHTCRLELANRHYHAITRSVYCVFSCVNGFGHILETRLVGVVQI